MMDGRYIQPYHNHKQGPGYHSIIDVLATTPGAGVHRK